MKRLFAVLCVLLLATPVLAGHVAVRATTVCATPVCVAPTYVAVQPRLVAVPRVTVAATCCTPTVAVASVQPATTIYRRAHLRNLLRRTAAVTHAVLAPVAVQSDCGCAAVVQGYESGE